METPRIKKVKAGLYEVIGASGDKAGTINVMARATVLSMKGCPTQVCASFKGAKIEAIKLAARY